MNKKIVSISVVLVVLLVILAACTPDPQVVEVIKEVEVEVIKEVEVPVERVVEVEVTPVPEEPEEPLLLEEGPFDDFDGFGYIVCLAAAPDKRRAAVNILITGEDEPTPRDREILNGPECYAYAASSTGFNYQYWEENAFSLYGIDPAEAEYQEYSIVMKTIKP